MIVPHHATFLRLGLHSADLSISLFQKTGPVPHSATSVCHHSRGGPVAVYKFACISGFDEARSGVRGVG